MFPTRGSTGHMVSHSAGHGASSALSRSTSAGSSVSHTGYAFGGTLVLPRGAGSVCPQLDLIRLPLPPLETEDTVLFRKVAVNPFVDLTPPILEFVYLGLKLVVSVQRRGR